jgi:signal transduction histidine kinase
LNRLKDELVMIAAHDIRAPLSVILGYCDILQSNEPQISESGREILGRVQASANSLLTMVNNILNLAALEEGRMDLKLAPTRLGTVIQDVMDSLSGMLTERELEWKADITGDEETYLLDSIKVSQILQNLLSNAIKFNRPGGTISIVAAGTPDEITIDVRDTGRGMTPEQAERAFQKFVRFASGSATGSGLGLAIAKGFVELHGGKISVETRRNEGTTFRFTLKPGHRESGPATSLLR